MIVAVCAENDSKNMGGICFWDKIKGSLIGPFPAYFHSSSKQNMSYQVFAYIEILTEQGWQLHAEPHRYADQADGNLAPGSWGGRNFAVYDQRAQGRGLPTDLSRGVKRLIDRQKSQWGEDAINRPNWLSLAELQRFQQADIEQEYAHFDVQFLLEQDTEQGLRVVFWAI